MTTEVSFASYLAALMKRRNLKAAQIAQYSGVGANTIVGWQRGSKPRTESLEKLASALGEDLGEMMRAAGYPIPTSARPPVTQATSDQASRLNIQGSAAAPLTPEVGMERLMEVARAMIPDRIPVQDSWVHAGDVGIEGQFVFRLPEWHGRRIVVFEIRGDCMAPEVQPGDRVTVDLDAEPEDDGLVVVRVDDEAYVRLYDERNGLLIAWNGAPPIKIDDVEEYAPVIDVNYSGRHISKRRRQSA